MNKILETKTLALLYLFIPVGLFLWNWFEWYYAIPIIGLTSCCLFHVSGERTEPLPRKTLAFIVLLVAAWVLLAGQGGYVFQNTDHLYRNAVLRDLVANEWPVVYRGEEGAPAMLCYYLTYWLPAALVGKLGGLDTAQLALYLWSLAGMLLVARLASSIQPRHAILLVCYLVMCGGADIIPYAAMHPESIRPWTHMEWYVPWQYSSVTTCLFWVFNQAIPAWICTILIMDKQTTLAQKVFISGIMYCYAPFPFLGIVMYVALDYAVGAWSRYRKCGGIGNWLAGEIQPLCTRNSIACLLGGISIILLGSTYFGCTGCGMPVYILHHFSIWKYVLFCSTEFLIPVGIMLVYRYQVRRVAICGAILLALPLFQIVSFPDYVMRVSIPALLILFLTFFSFMVEHRTNRKLLTACVLYAVVCSGVSCAEIARTVHHTAKGNHIPKYIETVTESQNFASWDFMERPYYKYFMKHTERLGDGPQQ